MPPPIVVVDTSTLYGHSGRKAIVNACNDGLMVAFWSPHIIAELNRVLTIRWFEKYGDSNDSRRQMSQSSKAMIDVLTRVLEIVDTGSRHGESPIELKDIDDHHLVRAARLSAATMIISENAHDFPPADGDGRHDLEGIEFLPLSKFLERLNK